MRLTLTSAAKSLNKAYLKQSVKREQIESFKKNLAHLFDRINEKESEENLKNIVSDFLKDTYYRGSFEINTKDRKDLVIHTGKSSSEPVGVIVEVKRPSNSAEMIAPDRPNAKAMHELLRYYMEERYLRDNKEIRRLVICNIYEWYIFDGVDFERFFFGNQKLVKSYKDWNDGLLVSTNADWFYQEIARPFIERELNDLPCVCFDLREFERIARKPEKVDDKKLITLYKILSPPHLLKLPFANDSNSLNRDFYNELLHILGLEETKEKGKKLIRRCAEGKRREASLLENTIDRLRSKGKVGAEDEERAFSAGLELCITWLNRILFLKLLEGRLVAYHKGDRSYAFLTSAKIGDYDELDELFFDVLARRPDERPESVRNKFGNIPYLNSSLFERTELEQATIDISSLKNRHLMPVFGATVLKDAAGKRLTEPKHTLQYLFEFLDAYDFASDGTADIQEQNKTIISAAVLGLIFEKINGYRDGSFFTPGFITMYMCRETIRRAVARKFNEAHGWSCESITDLYNNLDKIPLAEANRLVDSLKICDPAVGSGHFLVSALNEIIAIKSELGILIDRDGRRLRDYHVEIENDELIVMQEDRLFEYNVKDPESQRMQETLFHEKEKIIENCLFGVDINPKSVMICRLRLWIELLKNAYYTRRSNFTELETLPNIDINIKCGNSLISRFSVAGGNVAPADRKKLKELTEKYRRYVGDYKMSTPTTATKGSLRKFIEDLKHDLERFGTPTDKDLAELRKKENFLDQLPLFAASPKEAGERMKIQYEVDALKKRLYDKQRTIYADAFEWRFEFPEVLDDDGNFAGFDVVIGNPPYIRHESIAAFKPVFAEQFGQFYCGTADIYTYFYKVGLDVLRSNGYLCYISPNKFMRAGYGKCTRKLLVTVARPLQVLDFGDLPVFDEATTYPSIVLAEKKSPPPRPSPAGGGSSRRASNKIFSHPNGGNSGEELPTEDKKLFTPSPVPTPLLMAARALRGNMTDAEQSLWQCLRSKQLGGYRFRRQHPVERFVLDFYCCEARLAVELDGGQHNEADARVRDDERTALLEQHGIKVIRFWNHEIFTNLEGVLETIYQALQQRADVSSPLPTSPRWGEELESSARAISSQHQKNDEITASLPRWGEELESSAMAISSQQQKNNERTASLPQRGRGGVGEKCLAAVFTNFEQFRNFEATLREVGFDMPVTALKEEGWTLERPEVHALMEKLRKKGKPLGEYVERQIFYGIKTGLNEAFVIDEETRNQIVAENPNSTEIIRPWLRGKDIFKWKTKWGGLYILALGSSANCNWPWSKEVSEETAYTIFKREYPAICRHMSRWEAKLRKRDDQGKFWWELRSCAYYDVFDKTKILWPGISADPEVFSLDEEGFYGNDNNQLIISSDHCLLAILNSSLLGFVLRHICDKVQGGFFRLKIIYIEQLPIPPTTKAQQASLADCVKEILDNPLSHNVLQLETEIDRLVYNLYSLSEEEIALIEKQVKKPGKQHEGTT